MKSVSNFFSSVKQSVGQPASGSSTQSHRYSVATELATDTMSDLSPQMIIPGKIAQLFLSLKSLCSNDALFHEQLLLGTQAAFCALQAGLSIYLFMNGEDDCDEMLGLLCRMLYISELCYRGLLLTGWVSTEVSQNDASNHHKLS